MKILELCKKDLLGHVLSGSPKSGKSTLSMHVFMGFLLSTYLMFLSNKDSQFCCDMGIWVHIISLQNSLPQFL